MSRRFPLRGAAAGCLRGSWLSSVLLGARRGSWLFFPRRRRPPRALQISSAAPASAALTREPHVDDVYFRLGTDGESGCSVSPVDISSPFPLFFLFSFDCTVGFDVELILIAFSLLRNGAVLLHQKIKDIPLVTRRYSRAGSGQCQSHRSRISKFAHAVLIPGSDGFQG